MTHLESLIAEYLDWQGYLVKSNIKVGRLALGGWEMELDIIGYHPKSNHLVHCEPSLDAFSWEKREVRYKNKFEAGRRYIFSDIFAWLPPSTPLQQIAVFVNRPKDRDAIAGGVIISIDEFMAEVRGEIVSRGVLAHDAIPEQYPLLRTIQLTDVGYYRKIESLEFSNNESDVRARLIPKGSKPLAGD